MRQLMQRIQGWLDELGTLAASLVLVLALVDVMFPGSTGIVSNVAELLAGLSPEGRFSLVAIFLFLLVHHAWRTGRPKSPQAP